MVAIIDVHIATTYSFAQLMLQSISLKTGMLGLTILKQSES